MNFPDVLEKVGNIVTIPEDIVDLSNTEDVNNTQHCEGGFKKVHKLS